MMGESGVFELEHLGIARELVRRVCSIASELSNILVATICFVAELVEQPIYLLLIGDQGN
jgi:hypothetical protein